MGENKNTRITKLDGLRGLLSLIVCLNHSFMVLVIPAFANIWNQNLLEYHDLQSKLQQLFMFFGNGGAAVTLFFLLSGLVLGPSLSKVKFNFRGLLSFIVKRIIRLYPVYIFLIVITAIYMKTGFTHQTFPASSAWFNWWMNFQMTFKEFILNLFFIHTYLGGVTWTLRVILIASIIFPLFYRINTQTSKWVDLLITLVLIYLSFTVLDLPGFRDLRYLYMFYLGQIIPKFKGFFAKVPNWTVCLLLPAIIYLMFGFRYATDEYLGGLIESVVSFFLIGFAAFGPQITLLNFLDGKLLKFFGQISYSLYLIHFSVLYSLSRIMFIRLPQLPYADYYLLIHLVLFIVSTIIAVGIAFLVYRFIELPSQVLSRKIGDKISQE